MVKRALKETEQEVGKRKGKSYGWWDGECERKKREVRRDLRRWRKRRGSEETYKLEYKELCGKKKREENERGEKGK